MKRDAEDEFLGNIIRGGMILILILAFPIAIPMWIVGKIAAVVDSRWSGGREP